MTAFAASSTMNKLVAISITFLILGYGWLFAALFFILGLLGIWLCKTKASKVTQDGL
jgi:hypothetical protein